MLGSFVGKSLQIRRVEQGHRVQSSTSIIPMELEVPSSLPGRSVFLGRAWAVPDPNGQQPPPPSLP